MSEMALKGDEGDGWEQLSQSPLWRGLQSRLLDFGALPSTAHVLDFLCGSAEESRVLAERVAQVVAFQPDPVMLELARARLDALPHPRIHLVGGLPLSAWVSPERFDALYSLRLFWNGLPAPEQLLECQQLLRPGGVMVALLPTPRFQRAQLERAPSVQTLMGDELSALLKLADAPRQPCSESQLEQLLLPQGWRRLRTIELLDGLLLGLKIWR